MKELIEQVLSDSLNYKILDIMQELQEGKDWEAYAAKTGMFNSRIGGYPTLGNLANYVSRTLKIRPRHAAEAILSMQHVLEHSVDSEWPAERVYGLGKEACEILDKLNRPTPIDHMPGTKGYLTSLA